MMEDNWKDSLPDDVKSHPALSDIQDVSGLAKAYVDVKQSIDGDGWKAGLAEEYKNDPTLATIKDVNSLVKSFIHAQKMIGANKIAIPGKNASPDEIDEFYRAIGRPDDPDGYSLPKPTNDQDYDHEAHKKFRESMHKLGLTNAQARGIYDYLVEIGTAEYQAMEAAAIKAREELEATFRKEWGLAYEKNLAIANRLVDAFADKDTWKAVMEIGDPRLIRMFYKIGVKALEDDYIGGVNAGIMSPAQARSTVDAIMRDKSHPYHNSTLPGHAEAVREVHRLYEMMYPTSKA